MMYSGYTESVLNAMYLQHDPPTSPQGSMGPFPVNYLPTCQPANPWFATSSCPQDFILIAEFSEVEGPKPLITIPKDPGGKMDLNEFAVRIMSVDFQTVQSESFHLTEDTQVLLSESHNGIYAYVHHFTLYDCNARGFVRPFCMAYITPNQTKLISFSQEMSRELLKVSHYFKYGNMLLFVKDMTHYLTDLQFTRERYLEKSQEQQTGGATNNSQGNTLEDQIMQNMTLKTINGCIEEVKEILEKSSSQLTDKELEVKFRNYDDKCILDRDDVSPMSSSYNASHGSPKLSKLLRLSKSGSFSETSQPSIKNDMYKPKLVRTLNRRRFDHVMRNLHELCEWGAKEGLCRLHSVYNFYSRNGAILETEREDSFLMVPPSTMLTIGRLIKLNFLSNGFLNLDWPLKISQELGTRIRRWLSDETVASLNSFDLNCSVGYESYNTSSEPAFVLGSSYLERRESSSSFDMNNQRADCSINESTASSTDDILGSSGLASSSDFTESQNSLSRTVSILSPADHIVSLSSSSMGFGLLAFINQYAFAPHVIYSLLTGRTLVVLGSSKAEKEVRALVKTLTVLVPGHSGMSSVVIPWQTKAIKIADLAKMKLVGLSKPDRRNGHLSLQQSLRRYVSVLDIDKKIFEGPPYKGDLLTTIYGKRKNYKSERAFLALIHSMLMELALKAFVYYHAFCLKPKKEMDTREWHDPHMSDLQRVRSQAFLAGLSLGSHDGTMVQYFTEVVKGQQMEELLSQQHADNPPPPSITLHYEVCGTFKA